MSDERVDHERPASLHDGRPNRYGKIRDVKMSFRGGTVHADCG